MLQLIVIICLLSYLDFFGTAFVQNPTATAPPCQVGQKLQFRYDDGRSFTREITLEGKQPCVVKTASTFYYDKDWLPVKLVERTVRLADGSEL